MCSNLQGDGNIRYFEWVEEDKNIYLLSEYKSADPLRGLCFLPKRACNISECEVARIFKVHPTFVEPISFKVPRKVRCVTCLYLQMQADGFQADLFPKTIGGDAALKTAEWLSGKTCGPKMVCLDACGRVTDDRLIWSMGMLYQQPKSLSLRGM